MTEKNIFEIIDKFSAENGEPKYKQIASAVIQAVCSHQLCNGDKLPSINEMCSYYSISKATVQKSYDRLKKKGVLKSIHGKGFTICNDNYNYGINVFIMFDVLNSFKELMYQGILDTLNRLSGGKTVVDIFFHHFNEEHFITFVSNSIGKYEYYVVMPYENKRINEVLSKIDPEKLLILDRAREFHGEATSIITQDHDHELTRVLLEAEGLIKKYSDFVLCFPENRFNPNMIKHGYSVYCNKVGIKEKIINNIKLNDIKRNTAYLVIEDFDLVTLVEGANDLGLKVGKDIGILSYNNTPLKKIIEGGISVVSIDFYRMGTLVAEQIVLRDISYELMPTELIIRNTL